MCCVIRPPRSHGQDKTKVDLNQGMMTEWEGHTSLPHQYIWLLSLHLSIFPSPRQSLICDYSMTILSFIRPLSDSPYFVLCLEACSQEAGTSHQTQHTQIQRNSQQPWVSSSNCCVQPLCMTATIKWAAIARLNLQVLKQPLQYLTWPCRLHFHAFTRICENAVYLSDRQP